MRSHETTPRVATRGRLRGWRVRIAWVLVLVLLGAGYTAAQHEGTLYIDLFDLGFAFKYPDPAAVKAGVSFKSSIPAKIKALHGKRVRIDGFMIPYDATAGRVSEFMLVASYDACGFGDLPTGMTDWVHVNAKTAVGYTADPIVASGTLHVGEEFDEQGFVLSVYRLEADRVTAN